MNTTEPTHGQADPAILGEHAGYPVYAMPMFVTLSSSDAARTIDFFTRALDFGVMFVGPDIGGVPALVHLRRAKYQDVLVVPARSAPQAGSAMTVTFAAADADEIDALASRAASAALGTVEGPADTPWNTRDVTLTDPDGNRFIFTARAREPRNAGLGEILSGGRRDE